MEDLDSMIMESKTKKCSRCGLNGAFINCEYPGCHAKYHLPCAHSATDVVLHGSVGHLWCPKHTILGKLMNTVSRIEPIPLNYCVLVYFDLNFVKLQIVIVRKTNVSLKLKIQSMTLTKSLLQEQGVGFRSKSLDKSSMPSRKNRSKYRVGLTMSNVQYTVQGPTGKNEATIFGLRLSHLGGVSRKLYTSQVRIIYSKYFSITRMIH